MLDKVASVCRICSGNCGTLLTLDADKRIVKIEPDPDHPLTAGYACFKGLQTDPYSGSDRLLHPLKRMEDGSYQQIALEQALDEIAERLRQIIAQDGPEAVAAFFGTASVNNVVGVPMLRSFLRAVGSHKIFGTMTIDQPAKYVTPLRLGAWASGKHHFDQSDVVLVAGGNPIATHSVLYMPMINPIGAIKAAKARGLKMIVIDPRQTETASFADVFLQPYPGEDPTLVAGIIRTILEEGWEDQEFCALYVNGLSRLRSAVEPFTLDYVEKRAGVPASDVRAAAKLFAKDSSRGATFTSTGPDMAPRGNLAEHLYECLNVICGRYSREGDQIPNPGVLVERTPKKAEVIPPCRTWEQEPKSRIRNTGMLFGEMMTGIMIDEMLEQGPGQVKSLFVLGGNPANAVPDHNKTVRGLESLDLLVTIDPNMSTTAKLSHYILPPKINYETASITSYETMRYFKPFAQYVPAATTPPSGSDLADEHYFFWALIKRLGLTAEYVPSEMGAASGNTGDQIDMETPPTMDDMLDIHTRRSHVPLNEVRQYPKGHFFDVAPQFVEKGSVDSDRRFDVAPDDICDELREVAGETFLPSGRIRDHGQLFRFRLTCRRMRNVMNTVHYHPATRRRHPFNPAFMCPQDLASLGISAGQEVEISSSHGAIRAIVDSDRKLKPGVISMTHGFGGLSADGLPLRDGGSNTGLLISLDTDYDSITAMPRLSAVPVNVRPVGGLSEAGNA